MFKGSLNIQLHSCLLQVILFWICENEWNCSVNWPVPLIIHLAQKLYSSICNLSSWSTQYQYWLWMSTIFIRGPLIVWIYINQVETPYPGCRMKRILNDWILAPSCILPPTMSKRPRPTHDPLPSSNRLPRSIRTVHTTQGGRPIVKKVKESPKTYTPNIDSSSKHTSDNSSTPANDTTLPESSASDIHYDSTINFNVPIDIYKHGKAWLTLSTKLSVNLTFRRVRMTICLNLPSARRASQTFFCKTMRTPAMINA